MALSVNPARKLLYPAWHCTEEEARGLSNLLKEQCSWKTARLAQKTQAGRLVSRDPDSYRYLTLGWTHYERWTPGNKPRAV